MPSDVVATMAVVQVGIILAAGCHADDAAVGIGSRRELFVDRLLIEELKGARLELHHPRPAGVALTLDRPWEGAYCGYFTVLQDGDLYRMYYRGLPVENDYVGVTCVAQSHDGVHWARPRVGIYEEIGGSCDNNVVLRLESGDHVRDSVGQWVTHNLTPFLDTRPGVPPSERYKAVGGLAPGLYVLSSPDGIHWEFMQETPVMTGPAFDSQNQAFWSDAEGCYVCYFRTWDAAGLRRISRATSGDLLHWSPPVLMGYGDAPLEHMYTNGTLPYFRAPHIYIALAPRLMVGRRVLTDDQATALGIGLDHWLKDDCSETVLMSTRAGSDQYDRAFMEGFVRPGLGYANWASRANYPALGILQTGPTELSMYIQRETGRPTTYIERLVLRLDGFSSVSAGYKGGELITRPLVFSGSELEINYSTSAAGGIRVELQEPDGAAVPGYALADCDEVVGDEIQRVLTWHKRSDVSALAGRPVRLRLTLRDADLYAMRFR